MDPYEQRRKRVDRYKRRIEIRRRAEREVEKN
jgi:hypothetical protein